MKNLFASLVVPLIFFLVTMLGKVSAQSLLTYPIPDLGYCRDAKECYLYCQIPENKATCWSYGTYKLGPNVLGETTEDETKQMEEKAKKYGITFPIAELGSCTGPVACRNFCEQSTNHEVCINFAKKKGFYKESGTAQTGLTDAKKRGILKAAQTELGCTSMESCRTICEQNHERCEQFAKRHGLGQENEQDTQEKAKLLKEAKTELGCNSMESCRAICEQNKDRCIEFTRTHGLNQESQSQSPNVGRGPLVRPPCASEESCKRYCQEHPQECPGYQNTREASSGGKFSSTSEGFIGPSGCRTQEECKKYCEQYPTKCPGFPTFPSSSPYPVYTPYPTQYVQPTSYYPYPTSSQPSPYQNSSSGSYPSPTGSYPYPP